MEERRYDGDVTLTDNCSIADLQRASEDADNKLVALHRAGSATTDRKGRTYVVNSLGQWVRLRRHKNDTTAAPRREGVDHAE